VRRKYYNQQELCLLAVLIFVGTIALTAVGIATQDTFTHCAVAVAVGITVLFIFALFLSPVIAKFNAFALIQTSLSFSISGATFYFYTDTEEQYPEGPHFSETFYNSVLGSIGSIMSLVGIYLYQRYFSRMKYRDMWLMTVLVYCFLSVFDVLMFARVNTRIGIPDHTLVIGLTIFEDIVRQWQWMPQVVILSYLCPQGMEAIMYALLAGCHNLGLVISANCGALLLDSLNIKPKGMVNESEQFANLWVAATISTVLPLVAVVGLIKLVPDARQTDNILHDSELGATSGSMWRQLTGKAR